MENSIKVDDLGIPLFLETPNHWSIQMEWSSQVFLHQPFGQEEVQRLSAKVQEALEEAKLAITTWHGMYGAKTL